MKKRYKALFFILGFIFGFSMLSNPIHEFGHVLGAIFSGGTGSIVEWSLTETSGGSLVFIKYSGHAFHVLFFALLAISRKPFWAAFGGGGFIGTFLDTIDASETYGSDRYHLPAWSAVFWIWGLLLLAGIITMKIRRRIKFPPEARPPSKIISQFKKPSKYKTPLG